MKLLIMGTGPFAVPTFQTLLKSDHEVVCLVTRPDKIARGRKKAPPNPMRQAAEDAGIPTFSPENINDDEGLSLLDQQSADLYIVCDYGQILSKEALSKPKLGGINLHGSLLPKYRGAAPINWALLNGDRVAGITVIHMTPRLDGGPMICQRSLEVGAEEDAVSLESRLSQLGVEAVLEAIEQLESWDGQSAIGDLQEKGQVTKAPRLKKSDGEIDWQRSDIEVFNRVRALKPWPGTFSNLLREGKEPMRVLLREVALGSKADSADLLSADPGVAYGSDEGILVRCGSGVLLLRRIQPAGKREMDSAEFVRGYGNSLRFG